MYVTMKTKKWTSHVPREYVIVSNFFKKYLKYSVYGFHNVWSPTVNKKRGESI